MSLQGPARVKCSFLEVCPYATADPFVTPSCPHHVWGPAAWFPTGGAISEEKSGYILVLFACAHIHWFGKEMARRQARKSLLETLPAKPRIRRSSSVPESAACRLYVRKKTPCCQMACLSTKLPVLPKSGKRVRLLKKTCLTSRLGRAPPSDTCCHSLPGRCCDLPSLSAACGGLQDFADAQMPSGMLLTRALEQRVVFEDMTTLLSAVSAGSTGVVALPCLCHTQVAGRAWGHRGWLLQLSHGSWRAWSWFGYELQLRLWQ